MSSLLAKSARLGFLQEYGMSGPDALGLTIPTIDCKVKLFSGNASARSIIAGDVLTLGVLGPWVTTTGSLPSDGSENLVYTHAFRDGDSGVTNDDFGPKCVALEAGDTGTSTNLDGGDTIRVRIQGVCLVNSYILNGGELGAVMTAGDWSITKWDAGTPAAATAAAPCCRLITTTTGVTNNAGAVPALGAFFGMGFAGLIPTVVQNT